MDTTKMYEKIKGYRKEFVHEQYSRIVENFKDYDKVTKKKMIEEIYKVYSDYNNIIDICTTRELKYLKKLLNKKTDKNELMDKKYEWERKALDKKFLIEDDIRDCFIPDEIIANVKDAIKNVDWNVAKKKDELNEALVGYCKIQASAVLMSVCSVVSFIIGEDEETLWNHMLNNKLFNYYVMVYSRNFDNLGKGIPIALYQDYYSIEDELDHQRSLQGISRPCTPDVNTLRTFFYNDFDIHNKKVKKMLEENDKLPYFSSLALRPIREFAVLNIDRTSLKESIQSVPVLKNHDLTEFFKILDEAMDEMPSGALNGFSPNEAKKIQVEDEKIKYESEKKYIKQQNACLSKSDTKLFYKIYFALLEFTNNKFKIRKNFKIYKKVNLNPADLTDIIDKLWDNKELIVKEFCKTNPYKFNEEELKITNEFKNGIRDMFVIAAFEEEHTAFIGLDRAYMVKGLHSNIDEVISPEKLPTPVITTIIPFKNILTYDGILVELGIKMGSSIKSLIEKDYAKSMKYYHL